MNSAIQYAFHGKDRIAYNRVQGTEWKYANMKSEFQN